MHNAGVQIDKVNVCLIACFLQAVVFIIQLYPKPVFKIFLILQTQLN